MRYFPVLFLVVLLAACGWTPKPSRACIATYGEPRCQWSIDQSWKGM